MDYQPQEAADLLKHWEAAEAALEPNYDYNKIASAFRILSGGWEVHIYTSPTDDNAYLRFFHPTSFQEHHIYIHTSDDPLYHIFRLDTMHPIYSHEL